MDQILYLYTLEMLKHPEIDLSQLSAILKVLFVQIYRVAPNHFNTIIATQQGNFEQTLGTLREYSLAEHAIFHTRAQKSECNQMPVELASAKNHLCVENYPL